MKRYLCFAIVIALHSAARADDDKSDSLTLLPWSDTTFAVSSQDHRAVIRYTQLGTNGVGINLKVSAPLDDTTRTAAFLDNNRTRSGIRRGRAGRLGYTIRSAGEARSGHA